jgi:hypothetical protein
MSRRERPAPSITAAADAERCAAVRHWRERAERAEHLVVALMSEREALRERRISAAMRAKSEAADMLPVGEVARRLRVPPPRLKKAAQRARIVSTNLNGHLLVSVTGSADYVRARRLPPKGRCPDRDRD